MNKLFILLVSALLFVAFVQLAQAEEQFDENEFGSFSLVDESKTNVRSSFSAFQPLLKRNNFYKNDFSESRFLENNDAKRRRNTKKGRQNSFFTEIDFSRPWFFVLQM